MAKRAMAVLCLVMACMVAAVPYAEAITCGQVASGMAPCLGYLTKGGVVPPACCGAIKGLNSAAKSTPDRQAVCGCLKPIVASPGINLGNANSLAGQCGLNIPYKISPTTDCSKYV
ncbi:hypothetical protein SSX86_031662 [Deinandra increscens subsp. villosa]|uniref:Non-specific lipid-transfer protein n=1 Tax=Deinandra increscens subsp. villosa TaxID=3103831 RepID=A0AAP0C639_9ASTR